MNPIKGHGERYIYCNQDSECLDAVAKKGWLAFHCGQCPIYLQSPEFEQKQFDYKKKKNKEMEKMAEQRKPEAFTDGKNQLIDLNDALFKQMDRLTDKDLSDEGLQKEILRSKAVSNLAAQIVQNAKLALEGAKAIKAGAVDSGTLMLGRGK